MNEPIDSIPIIDDTAIDALETAFAALGDKIEAPETKAAIELISRAIVNAILTERGNQQTRLLALLTQQSGMRSDMRALIAAINEHKSYVSGRVHQIANHVTSIEMRSGELSELIMLYLDATDSHNATDPHAKHKKTLAARELNSILNERPNADPFIDFPD